MKSDIEKELVEIDRQLARLEKDKSEELYSTKLTREMVCELVEYIYALEDNNIKIDFKFADEIEEALNRVET